MGEKKKIIRIEEVTDPDMMSKELDNVVLERRSKTKGIILFLVCSFIGIAVFFGQIGGSTIFGILYNGFVDMFGQSIYWILTGVITANFVCHVYFKYIDKGKTKNAFADVYENDKIIHTFLYGLGVVYIIIYTLWIVHGIDMPEIIISDTTGGNVIPPIVKGVFGIVLAGAVFMPFLLNYGILEIIGVLLEPLMRPLFKVPGKSALGATASFVSSSSLGVLLTNRMWKNKVYTEKEMVAIMTGFSAVSIGFAQLVIDTAGCGSQFFEIYAVSFVMVFLIEMVTVRIPPIFRKKDVYYNGKVQTEEERREGAHYSVQTIPTGIQRSVKRAAVAYSVPKNVGMGLKDSILVLPQVLTMLSAIGVSAMILAEYTPVFKWLGYIFQPVLMLCQVPDAAAIAPSMPVGIAEMLLPVLVMNSTAATVSVSMQARVFVCLVSMCQIIFFSETATVMMATKSPIKFWEIIVCFVERTLIAIPLASLAVHLIF